MPLKQLSGATHWQSAQLIAGWHLALPGLFEVRLDVRSTDAERLQSIYGLLPALTLAAGVRLYAVLRFPFLHDEPRLADGLHAIMGYGPSQSVVGAWPQSFLFGAPLAGGMQNVTPLWWWLEYAVLRLWPGHDALALRLPPLVFGLSGLVLFFGLARRIFEPPIPALLVWWLAVHDIYLWLGTKAQFVETAVFVAALVVARALLVARGRWGSFAAASLAATLATAYFFVKGLMLAAHALAVGAVQVLFPPGRERRLHEGWDLIAGRFLLAILIGAPLIAWLVAAQRYIGTNYQVRIGDIGYFRSILGVVNALTLGYGQAAHHGQTGPPWTALLYYTHADAWPTSTFLSLWIVAGCGLAASTLWAGRRGGRGTRWHVALYVVMVTILGLAPVLWKGIAGERFHMPYFVAALLASGLTLEQLWLGRHRGWGLFLLLVGLYVGAMLSWADWVGGKWQPGAPMSIAVAIGLLAGGGYVLAPSAPAGTGWRRLIVLGVVAAGVVLSLVRGPLDWGLTAAYSPEPSNGVLQTVEARYHPN